MMRFLTAATLLVSGVAASGQPPDNLCSSCEWSPNTTMPNLIGDSMSVAVQDTECLRGCISTTVEYENETIKYTVHTTPEPLRYAFQNDCSDGCYRGYKGRFETIRYLQSCTAIAVITECACTQDTYPSVFLIMKAKPTCVEAALQELQASGINATKAMIDGCYPSS